MYKLYLQKGDVNQATAFYIDIIKKSIEDRIGTVEVVDNVEYIQKKDIVVVVAMYSLISVIKHRFNQQFIYWFQGLNAEETTFGIIRPSFRTILRKQYMSLWEWFCVHKSSFNLFVSQSMLNHYRRKYHYKDDNYYIMPCYNQEIDCNAFNKDGKYTKPSIVYAGAMLPWQCVDELFQLYARLKEKLPNASLTILTKDKAAVYDLMRKYKVDDVTVDFVKLESLNEYIARFKYGFLLRQDDIVNNVATPTKFNSYLAAGVIPIVSETIHAYIPIIRQMHYCISADDEKDIDSVVDQIVKMENTTIKGSDVFNEYKQIFDYYYNTTEHITQLSEALVFDNMNKKLKRFHA